MRPRAEMDYMLLYTPTPRPPPRLLSRSHCVVWETRVSKLDRFPYYYTLCATPVDPLLGLRRVAPSTRRKKENLACVPTNTHTVGDLGGRASH